MSHRPSRRGRFVFASAGCAAALALGALAGPAAPAAAQPPPAAELVWAATRGRVAVRRSRPERSFPRRRLRGRCGGPHRVEAGPSPALPAGPVHVDRRIGEAGRFRDRPERDRRHAGRRATLAVTVPYYEFREVLTVRAADASRIRTLDDLRGRRAGTLGGTIAYEILLGPSSRGVVAVSYDDDVHPYSDLALGRIDAVLLDHVLAEKAMRRERGLVTHRRPWPLATTSACSTVRTPSCATGSTSSCSRRCATAGWRTSSGAGALERRPAEALRAGAGPGAGPARGPARPRHACRSRALPSRAPARGPDHDRAVVPSNGARGGLGVAVRAGACTGGVRFGPSSRPTSS